MTRNKFPIAAKDIVAIMSLGFLRNVGHYPPTAACLIKDIGGADSIWIDLNYPTVDYRELWRTINKSIPAGYEVKLLLSAEEARRSGFHLVRLGLVSTSGRDSRLDNEGKYVLTSVRHSANSGSGNRIILEGRLGYRS